MRVHKRGDISPWVPMTRPIDLKHIGKLIEELGELQAALARCLVQGIDESEPTSGKLNRSWLREEISDVLAGIELCVEHFDLNRPQIRDRMIRKLAGLRKWHGMLS